MGQFGFFENGIALKSVQLLRRTRTSLGEHFVKRDSLEVRPSKWAVDSRAVMGSFTIFYNRATLRKHSQFDFRFVHR
jgi:hypothetical protein